MDMSSSSSSTQIKRACDACHRRKVKCIGDGTRPCKNCTSSGLSCTYNSVPQKKGPKGSRAKVISELRETQRRSQLSTQRQSLESSPGAAQHARKDGLLSADMISTCVEYYFANIYPAQPILHRSWVATGIGQMDTDMEAYCLVVGLCSYTLMQPNLVLPESAFEGLEVKPQPNSHLGSTLLQEALRVRKGLNYVENHTVWSVITSFFFFSSYFSLDRHNLAWFHLREATTLAQLMERTMNVNEDSLVAWLAEKASTYEQHTPFHMSSVRSNQDTSFIISKMNETMPNAAPYAISLMPETGSSAFEGSPGSLPTSKDSTPFGSPPLSAVGSQPSVFGGFQHDMDLTDSPVPSSFPGVVLTASVDYGGLNAAAPMHGFPDVAYHTVEGQMRYESDG